MNPLLEDKKKKLENAVNYECWYLVKQPTAFDNICYLTSFLKEYKSKTKTKNIENFISDKLAELQPLKPDVTISNNYRALRVAANYGLITMTSTKYDEAQITETFEEITKRCGGDYEKTELYQDIINRQIEKIYMSSVIDEGHSDVRKDYQLYPVALLYKVLLELGRSTGRYYISMTEYRYIVATTKNYADFLETLLLIKLLREDESYNEKFEQYKLKFDNRFIQALKQLDTLAINGEGICLKEESIDDVAAKIHFFDSKPEIHQCDNYLRFLGSVKPLFNIKEESINIKVVEKKEEEERKIEAVNEYIPLVYKTGVTSKFERNRIIFGAPGTGKSYQLKENCEEMMNATLGSYERVTFHPEYSYSQFVGTYKPVTDKEDKIKYTFVPGPFMRVYVDALKSGRTDSPQPHLLLVEEINRAKVAAVFGDIFQLLDRDDDGVSEYEIQASEDIRNYLAKELGGMPEQYNKIRIPDNMFIWSTMNSADQGVFPMDTAFKRRWNFEYIGINDNEKAIKGRIVIGSIEKQEVEWNMLRKAINDKLAEDYKVNEDKLMGPFFLSKKVIKTVSDSDDTIADENKFKDAFKSKVIMYLYEDAGKQYKHKLFAGCKDTTKYSTVCESFDCFGMKIFGDEFEENFYNRQKDDE